MNTANVIGRATVALILIFSTGGIAVIASIVRINALYIFQSSTDLACE